MGGGGGDILSFRAAVLALALAPITIMSAPAAPKSTPATESPQQRYVACLDQAATNPVAARKAAEAWAAQGGGDAATHCLAAARLALGEPVPAAEALERLATKPDAPPERRVALRIQAGDAWIAAGDPGRAAAAYDGALAVAPDNRSALLGRGVAFGESGRLEAAIEDFTRAIDLDPVQPQGYVLRAAALRRADKLARAAVDVESALALSPRDPDALLERGVLRERAGDAAGARADWRQVVLWSPSSAAAAIARARLDATTSAGQPQR